MLLLSLPYNLGMWSESVGLGNQPYPASQKATHQYLNDKNLLVLECLLEFFFTHFKKSEQYGRIHSILLI